MPRGKNSIGLIFRLLLLKKVCPIKKREPRGEKTWRENSAATWKRGRGGNLSRFGTSAPGGSLAPGPRSKLERRKQGSTEREAVALVEGEKGRSQGRGAHCTITETRRLLGPRARGREKMAENKRGVMTLLSSWRTDMRTTTPRRERPRTGTDYYNQTIKKSTKTRETRLRKRRENLETDHRFGGSHRVKPNRPYTKLSRQ